MTNTVYQLQHPITVGERTITELRIKQATVKDIKVLEPKPNRSNMEGEIAFMAQLTGEPMMIIEALQGEDWSALESMMVAIAKKFAGATSNA